MLFAPPKILGESVFAPPKILGDSVLPPNMLLVEVAGLPPNEKGELAADFSPPNSDLDSAFGVPKMVGVAAVSFPPPNRFLAAVPALLDPEKKNYLSKKIKERFYQNY